MWILRAATSNFDYSGILPCSSYRMTMSEWGSNKVLAAGIKRNPSFKVVRVEDQLDALLRCWEFYRLSTYKEAAPVAKRRKREVSSFHFCDFTFDGYSSGGMIQTRTTPCIRRCRRCSCKLVPPSVVATRRKGREEGACGASAAQPALGCALCQSRCATGAIPTTRAGVRH